MTTQRPATDAAQASPTTIHTAVHATRGGAAGPCSGCGAVLAADQRYCVECGRRTGEARPTLMREPGRQQLRDLGATEASAPAALRSGGAPQGTLIVGVGVLLLAVGVGVLIGHTGRDDTTAKAAVAPQYVIAGPTAAAATTPAGAVAATTPDGAAAAADASDSTAKEAKAAKKAAKAAAAAAKAPAVVAPKAGKKVELGDKGSGPGYDKKSGEFTGDFFGN